MRGRAREKGKKKKKKRKKKKKKKGEERSRKSSPIRVFLATAALNNETANSNIETSLIIQCNSVEVRHNNHDQLDLLISGDLAFLETYKLLRDTQTLIQTFLGADRFCFFFLLSYRCIGFER
jgi:hypothetical protein